MTTILSVLSFFEFHRMIAAIILVGLSSLSATNPRFNRAWNGRAARVRGVIVFLLLGMLLAVGCDRSGNNSRYGGTAHATQGPPSGCASFTNGPYSPVAPFFRRIAAEFHRMAGFTPQIAGQSSSASSVPAVELQGNRTLLATPFDSSGNVYGVGLQRQADCSVTEYILADYNPITSTFSVKSTVPDYQNNLHSLAMLKTQANRFANGCKDAMLGISSGGAVVLGMTKDGSQYIAAGINPFTDTLLTGTVNLSTGAISQTTQNSISNPASVATADVNGDGIDDLLVVASNITTGAGSVSVFLSNGDGTFKPPVTYATGGMGSDALTIDDVNNDGKLDLVVTGYVPGQNTNGVQVLLGNGDGTFKTAVPSPVAGDEFLATGDFNGDGKRDLVLAGGAILLGNGDGTFNPPAVTLPGSNYGVPAVGDFNGDGKLDIAFNVRNGPYISIFLGKGDGTFTAGKSYASIGDSTGLTVTDIDGDGNLDLLVGSSSFGQYGPSDGTATGLVNILMGNGDGTFQGAQAFPNTVSGFSINGLQQAPNFAVADFNGDGKLDILGVAPVNGSGTSGLLLLAGDGQGNFSPGSPLDTNSSPTIITAADMNGDGKLDAVIVDQQISVGVAFGDGKGGFQPVVDYALPASSNEIENMVLGDFNGDGKPDVLVTAQSGSGGGNAIYLFLNQGNGTLGSPTTLDAPTLTPAGLAAGDLNGDGKLDFIITTAGQVVGNTSGALLVYLGKGNGTFSTPVSYAPGYFPGAVAIADMNKDGKPDVIVGSADQKMSQGTISVYLGKGDGSLEMPQTLTVPDTSFISMAVADIDGDGNSDVIVGQTLATVAFGNGDGTLRAAYSVGVGQKAVTVTAVDINGDKRPDLLFADGSENAINTLLNMYGSVSTLAATTTGLTISPNPATLGQTVTFTAQVTGSGGTPTGTVIFLNGATQIGTGSLNGSGQATYSTSSLAAGMYSITANYGGDPAFDGSTSSPVSLTVNAAAAPDFTLSTSSGSLSVAPGQSGTDTISVTPANGFNQAVSFACSGLPSESQCSFSPSSVTPNGAATSTTLTVTTTAPGAQSRSHSMLSGWPAGGMTLGLLLMPFIYKKRRFGWVLVLLCAISMMGMIGCTGSSGNVNATPPANPGTPAGTSTVTVTATAGAISHTANVSLTVQ